MRERHLKTALIVAVVGLLLFAGHPESRGDESIRPPAVAGRFYPESPDVLRLAVQRLLEDALPATVKKPVALVVPHAGYVFSGQIAADAFKQTEGNDYKTIVILGTNHTSATFRKVSVYNGRGFRTPLGVAEADRETAERLLQADKDCVVDNTLHESEHSIEVQVPFIQVLFPRARIVPVVVGSADLDICVRFGEALANALKDRKALIVVSADLSHYPAAKDAQAVDREVLRAVADLEPARLKSTIERQMARKIVNLDTCACGEAPLLAAMEAAKRMGAKGGKIVSYANSGDTALGDQSRVVGYGALVLTAEKVTTEPPASGSEPPYSDTFTAAEKKTLLSFARKTITQAVTTQTLPLARGFGPNLQQKRGVFVTLRRNGELRGCVGRTEPDTPLARIVGAMAVGSAFGDKRFLPVSGRELPEIDIEISILTRLKRVSGSGEIVLGRDGVVLTKGARSALFLPQVATDEKWDKPTMLNNLCLKAGLDAACWKSGAQFSTFQAIVFREEPRHRR